MASAGSDGTEKPSTDPDKGSTESNEPDNSSDSKAPVDDNTKCDTNSVDPSSTSTEQTNSSSEQKKASGKQGKKTQSTGSNVKRRPGQGRPGGQRGVRTGQPGRSGQVAPVPSQKPMPQKLNADYNLIPIPLPYLDTLASRELVGNTPRPTEIKNHFFHGMRHIQNNRIAEGEMKLRDAAKAANDLVNGSRGQSKKKAARVDVESLAYATMGLGYACFRSNKIKIAARCYLRSHALWAKLNPSSDKSHCLISILADSVILLILSNDLELGRPQMKKFLNLVEANRSTKGSDLKPEEILLIARGIARVACVSSGQRGASLRVPIKKKKKTKGNDPKDPKEDPKAGRSNSKKIFEVHPTIVGGLYEDSIAWMRKVGKDANKAQAQKELIEILQLYQEFLQSQAPPSESTSSTTSESTSTTTTSTTSSTSTTVKKTSDVEVQYGDKLGEVNKLLNSLTNNPSVVTE